MRVPRPPASTTTGRDARASGTNDDGRAVVVEAEPNLGQALSFHRRTKCHGIVGEEEQEAPATRTRELAADGAVRASGRVPAVDVRIRHTRRALAFLDPVLVHELAEAGDVAGDERVTNRDAEL